ncbi:hypothetical protein UY3_10006 [Chelonia mydas]|uniref:Uncharacterized protein n=1 Tax=Chelonia mydas TaxID=8469 RepID=M7B6Z1_CHEMY|nr:hypothetical protein UY3_10006 [Chelonia mydas]
MASMDDAVFRSAWLRLCIGDRRGTCCCFRELLEDKDFAKVGEDESEHSRDVPDEEQYPYDTVKTSSLEAMHALKILPAKPIQESEYAGPAVKRSIKPNILFAEITTPFAPSKHPLPPPRSPLQQVHRPLKSKRVIPVCISCSSGTKSQKAEL